MSEVNSIFTLGNFNLQNFNAALKKEIKGFEVESVEYEQMFPYLLKLSPADQKKMLGICWLSLRDVFQASAMKLDLAELVLKMNTAFHHSIVIVPAFDSPSFNMIQGFDLRKQLYALELKISELAEGTNLVVLDPTPWLVKQGSNSISNAHWYLTKTPFHQNVFKSAAETCKHTLNAFIGQTKKVLIVDLDDTLWGGIVGDDGIENLRIGGHDAVGEAFVDFQKWIQHIKSWGIVLCICSKNDEKTALEVFEKHSGMVLKKEDFVKWRINWNDKAANIAEMVAELNVGLDSVVFLDDSPAERSRVRMALPDVYVPEMPEEKLDFPAFIRSLGCFSSLSLTEEDRNRTNSYKQEIKRKESEETFASVDDWISSLNIQIEFMELSDENIVRAEQLLNKTNQMNLRTRRLSKDELKNWAKQKDHWFYVVQVKDVFGDNGITGLLGFHKTDKTEIFIDDFVMSCRVMGRRIEHTMLEFVHQKANEQNSKLVVEYLPTDKNKPVKDFFETQELIIFNF